jgi:hypothetical protein
VLFDVVGDAVGLRSRRVERKLPVRPALIVVDDEVGDSIREARQAGSRCRQRTRPVEPRPDRDDSMPELALLGQADDDGNAGIDVAGDDPRGRSLPLAGVGFAPVDLCALPQRYISARTMLSAVR